MSSRHDSGHHESNVVDGIYAPIGINEKTSVAATKIESNPWIQIDLSRNFCVSAVKIWNRYLGNLNIFINQKITITSCNKSQGFVLQHSIQNIKIYLGA